MPRSPKRDGLVRGGLARGSLVRGGLARGGRQAVTALVTLVVGLAVIACGSVALAVSSHPTTDTTAPKAPSVSLAPPATSVTTSAAAAPPSPAAPVTMAAPVVPATPAAPAAPVTSANTQATSASIAAPVALTIPNIAVSTPLIRLGLTPSGTLEVPSRFDVAGWYDRSPRPGATGPAVIAGHIDSVNGPAVFYRLSLLHPGDQVYVHRADGTTATFTVTRVALYPKSHFPTAAVYGPAPGPELRLITCGGTFDWSRHSYLSNVVVYATARP
jgi:sortase (surface protein transpeptidase)